MRAVLGQRSFLKRLLSEVRQFPAARGYNYDKVPSEEYVLTVNTKERNVRYPVIHWTRTGSDRYCVYEGRFNETAYQRGSAKSVPVPGREKIVMLEFLDDKEVRHTVQLEKNHDVVESVTLMNQQLP
jgi:hypothetical protein